VPQRSNSGWKAAASSWHRRWASLLLPQQTAPPLALHCVLKATRRHGPAGSTGELGSPCLRSPTQHELGSPQPPGCEGLDSPWPSAAGERWPSTSRADGRGHGSGE